MAYNFSDRLDRAGPAFDRYNPVQVVVSRGALSSLPFTAHLTELRTEETGDESVIVTTRSNVFYMDPKCYDFNDGNGAVDPAFADVITLVATGARYRVTEALDNMKMSNDVPFARPVTSSNKRIMVSVTRITRPTT